MVVLVLYVSCAQSAVCAVFIARIVSSSYVPFKGVVCLLLSVVLRVSVLCVCAVRFAPV